MLLEAARVQVALEMSIIEHKVELLLYSWANGKTKGWQVPWGECNRNRAVAPTTFHSSIQWKWLSLVALSDSPNFFPPFCLFVTGWLPPCLSTFFNSVGFKAIIFCAIVNDIQPGHTKIILTRQCQSYYNSMAVEICACNILLISVTNFCYFSNENCTEKPHKWGRKKLVVGIMRLKSKEVCSKICWWTLQKKPQLLFKAAVLSGFDWQNVIRWFLEKCCVNCQIIHDNSCSKQYSQLYFRHWKGVQNFSVCSIKEEKKKEISGLWNYGLELNFISM